MKGDFVDIREVEDNDAVVVKGISDSFSAPSDWFLAGEKREIRNWFFLLHTFPFVSFKRKAQNSTQAKFQTQTGCYTGS